MNDKSFHEKTGPSQGGFWFFAQSYLPGSFPSKLPLFATLPSALLVSFFSSVHYECSQFSRCCHLFGVLISLPHRERARTYTQSPERGAWVLTRP